MPLSPPSFSYHFVKNNPTRKKTNWSAIKFGIRTHDHAEKRNEKKNVGRKINSASAVSSEIKEKEWGVDGDFERQQDANPEPEIELQFNPI